MSDDFTTTTLHGRTCHLYRQNTAHTFPRLPVFYWGISRGNKDAVMTVVSYLKTHQPKAGFYWQRMSLKAGMMISRRGRRRQSLGQKPLAGRGRIPSSGSPRAVCHSLSGGCAKLPVFRSDILLQGFLVYGYTVNANCLQEWSVVPPPCGMRAGWSMCRNSP